MTDNQLDKKDNGCSDTLEGALRKIIQKKPTTNAPPPIRPVDGQCLRPKRIIPDEPKSHETPFIPITGTELMERWSVGFNALFHFAHEGYLTPYGPERFKTCVEYDFGMLSFIYTQQERDEYFSQWLYHPNAVESFEKSHANIIDGLRDKPSKHKNVEPEKFIRSMCLSYENDDSIKLKIGSKKSRIYSATDLGFRDAKTKTWKTFIRLLEKKEFFYTGTAHGAGKQRNRDYDANHQTLREISKKIIAFLSKTYGVRLPDAQQIFERINTEAPGTYGPVFTISDPDYGNALYENLPKEELLETIASLSRKEHMDTDEKSKTNIHKELTAAVVVACAKGWMSQNRARSYLQSTIDR